MAADGSDEGAAAVHAASARPQRVDDTEDWTARRSAFPRPCKGTLHCFAPDYQGRFRVRGLLRDVVAFDRCTCGAKRWSEPMAWTAVAYAEAATS